MASTKKAEVVSGNSFENLRVQFTMSVKGGCLPKGQEFSIETTVTFRGLTETEAAKLICSQGVRVPMQAFLRGSVDGKKPHMDLATLRRLESSGLVINYDEIDNEMGYMSADEKAAKQKRDAFAYIQSLPEHLRKDLLAQLEGK